MVFDLIRECMVPVVVHLMTFPHGQTLSIQFFQDPPTSFTRKLAYVVPTIPFQKISFPGSVL